MSDYISKSEVVHTVTEVELKDGTFTEVKMKIGAIKTLNENEIIRKAFERVVERLEENKRSDDTESAREWGKYIGYVDAIKIIKEESGISE